MKLRIADRFVGSDEPVYLVAEIGINHNGDMDLARRTIDAAKAAGADAVKFQNYRTEDFVTDLSLTHTYETVEGPRTEQLYSMFKRAELSPSMLSKLAAHCANVGIHWHSTPTSAEGTELLVSLGSSVIKNGSDYLGHLPLIAVMARTGLPVVLSTGMATLSDIEDAVETLRTAGNPNVVLLQCTSQYPTPAGEANVRRVASLAQVFGCVTGFSDHTEGNAASVAAVALGARWIEKHFTLDKTLPGPDHKMSCDPPEFAKLVSDVRFTEEALGDGSIRLSTQERAAREAHRLSCAAARDLNENTVIEESDVSFVRPGSGMSPKFATILVGRTLQSSVPKGQIFKTSDFA